MSVIRSLLSLNGDTDNKVPYVVELLHNYYTADTQYDAGVQGKCRTIPRRFTQPLEGRGDVLRDWNYGHQNSSNC